MCIQIINSHRGSWSRGGLVGQRTNGGQLLMAHRRSTSGERGGTRRSTAKPIGGRNPAKPGEEHRGRGEHGEARQSTSGERGGDPAKPGEAHRGGEGETRRSPAKPSGVGWNPAKPGEAHRGRSGGAGEGIRRSPGGGGREIVARPFSTAFWTTSWIKMQSLPFPFVHHFLLQDVL